MANLASFISELATVAGVKVDSLAPFVEANKALEIPDDVVNGIKGGILTMESAKNNPIIKAHFTATSRAGIDDEVYATMKEYGLDDAAIEEAKREEATTKKVRLLAFKIKDAFEKKINAKGGDKELLAGKILELEKQLADVNADAAKKKEEFDQKVKEAQDDFFNQLRGYKENEHFATYEYSGDPKLRQTQAKLAKLLVEEEMKRLGLKTVFDKETGQNKLLTSTDTIYYKDNKPIDYKAFADGVLAENHLLKVSEPPKGGAGNPDTKIVIPPANGQGKVDNSRFLSAIEVAGTPVAKQN